MKKTVVFMLAAVLCCSFTGCTKKVDNSENTLEIAYYDAGYGYEFIERWGEKFEASHPGVSVVLSKSSDVDPKDLLSAGPGEIPSICSFTELFLTATPIWVKKC